MPGDLQSGYRRGTQIDSHRDGVIGALAARQHGVRQPRPAPRCRYDETDAPQATAQRPTAETPPGRLRRRPRPAPARGPVARGGAGRGPGAALSHRGAAALHGIRESDGAVDVTTTRRVAVRGVVVHRTTVLDAQDVTTRRGVRATTVERTLMDLAGILTAEQLGKLLRETDRRGRLDALALREALSAHERPPRRKGTESSARRAPTPRHVPHPLRARGPLSRPPRCREPAAAADQSPHPRHEGGRRLARRRGLPWSWTAGPTTTIAPPSRKTGRDRRACWPRAGRTVRFTHAHVVDRPRWVADTLRTLLAR